MEFAISLNFRASVPLIEMEVRMATSLGDWENPTQHKMTHFKVSSLGLVFSGDPGTKKKKISTCNMLHLNRLDDSHSYTNQTSIN